MDERILQRLSDSTEQMYNSVMEHLKNGYYTLWNPKIQELNTMVEELVADYGKCLRGEILECQYQGLLQEQKQCLELEKIVFEQGKVERMELFQKEFLRLLTGVKETLEMCIAEYDMLEDKFQNVYDCEYEFVSISHNLIKDYKARIRNRMQLNIDKVSQFQKLSAEERKYFMTHVILFDEGKLENTILSHLTTAEKKVQDTFKAVEQKAIICGRKMTFSESREYVHAYRKEQQKEDPRYLSTSRRLEEAEAIENKFESWFESLLGNESTVGQLINEEKSDDVLPMEERMVEAIENAVNSNLGGLNMIEMIEAYKEECAALKEYSFKSFFGEYEQIKSLLPMIKRTEKVLLEWETCRVGLAEIVMGDYLGTNTDLLYIS